MRIKSTIKPSLLLILGLAFFLRMNGLAFGLPYLFHDDEHQYVEAGLAFLQNREAIEAQLIQLNNPPLFKEVLGGVYLLTATFLLPDPAARAAVLTDNLWGSFFYFLGRLISVATGLLTVALVYALGRRLYRRQTGLVGALLLAVAFLPVRESHFAVNDASLAFLVVITMFFATGILKQGRWRDYLLTGLAIGLAAATKYTGAYLVVVPIIAHWGWLKTAEHRSSPAIFRGFLSPRLGAGLALAPAGFLLGAPVVMRAPAELLRHLDKLAEYGRLGYHDLLLAPAGGWWFYLDSLAWGLGFLLLLAALIALGLTLFYRNAADLLLAVYPLLLFIMMGAQQMVFVRFILPATPPLALLAAAWLVRLAQSPPRLPLGLGHRRAFQAGLLALLVLQPLAMSLWLGVLWNRTDTRELAARWVKDNLPAGAVVYTEEHALPRYAVTGRVDSPYVQLEPLAFNHPELLAYYRARGVQYLLTSDYHHARLFSDPAKESGRRQWVNTLGQQLLVQEFQPYRWPGWPFAFDQRYGPWSETFGRFRPGPTIRLYGLPPLPNWYGLDPDREASRLLDRAALFGLQVPPEATPGIELETKLYWLKKDWQETDQLFVALIDPAGFEIVRAVTEPAPGFDLSPEADSDVIQSQAHLPIPWGTPPGAYYLRVGIFDPQQVKELAALTVEEKPVTVKIPVETLRVKDEVRPAGRVVAPGLELVAHDLVAADALQADTLVQGQANWLVLLWRATEKPETDFTIQLALLNSSMQAITTWTGQPVHGTYPTSAWQAGQLVRDPWQLSLPETGAADPAGETYQLQLTVFDQHERSVGSAALGAVRVSRRAATSAVPAMQHTVKATWVEAFSLLGFNIRALPETSQSGWLELDLYWQSLEPAAADYLIRVELIDRQGQVVLAQEGPPAGGQAPLSSWQPGEVIHDFRSLRYENLTMAESYRLELAVFNPQTGEILPVQGEGEATAPVVLTTWP